MIGVITFQEQGYPSGTFPSHEQLFQLLSLAFRDTNSNVPELPTRAGVLGRFKHTTSIFTLEVCVRSMLMHRWRQCRNYNKATAKGIW
jgi:hypothetical protein